VDEFQNFTTLAVANMLSELRKYRVGFSIAHQYLHQLEPDIRHAVLGNVGTMISFRIGAEDSLAGARDEARQRSERRGTQSPLSPKKSRREMLSLSLSVDDPGCVKTHTEKKCRK
jgi:DNA helicase HerA-like ATPase